jgi:predicted PurR-regulated permease PerM
VLAVIVAVLIAFGAFFGAQIAAQVDELGEQLPQSLDQLREELNKTALGSAIAEGIPTFSSDDPQQQQGQSEDGAAEAGSQEGEEDGEESDTGGQGSGDGSGGVLESLGGTNILSQGATLAALTLDALATGFALLFIAIYLAFEPQDYVGSLIRLFPPQRRARAAEVIDQVGLILQRWMLARFLSMGVVGIMTVIGLTLLGIPLALTLGIIAGLLSFIPTFGPIISVVPAALIALLEGPTQALWVLGLYVLVQQIDNYLFTPLFERKTVSLRPAMTLSSQLILGGLVGFAGLVVAAPLAAAALILVRMLYVEDILGDDLEPLVE